VSQKTKIYSHLLESWAKLDPEAVLRLKLQHDEKYEMFEAVRNLLFAYAPPLHLSYNNRLAELWSHREVYVFHKRKKELFFSAVGFHHEKFVSFYYMPLNVFKNFEEKLKPELLALRAGKTCFHLKNYNEEVVAQIKEALKIGFEEYRKKEWV
jgi:hypothetical protein